MYYSLHNLITMKNKRQYVRHKFSPYGTSNDLHVRRDKIRKLYSLKLKKLRQYCLHKSQNTLTCSKHGICKDHPSYILNLQILGSKWESRDTDMTEMTL